MFAECIGFYFAFYRNLRLTSINADALAVTAHALKLDPAVDQRKERVVASAADIDTRVNLSAALTDKDIAGKDILAVCALYAKALRLAITSVLC